VGNPIRTSFVAADRASARRALGLRPHQQLLTVVGGSSGAAAINDRLADVLPGLLADLPHLVVHHQTGQSPYAAQSPADGPAVARHDASPPSTSATLQMDVERADSVRAEPSGRAMPQISAPAHGGGRYRATAFIEDMATQLSGSDLVVSRAGAVTCSELLAAGSPSLLIPLRSAADDHQRYNAAAMVEAGAARVLHEGADGVAPEALDGAVRRLLSDGAALQEMRKSARAHGRLNAAADIAAALFEAAGGFADSAGSLSAC